jgi:hypothetical protein
MSRLLAATAPGSSPYANQPNAVTNEMTGTFSRIVRGDSFRLEVVRSPGGGRSAAAVDSATSKGLPTSASLPPARILDLKVEVRTSKQKLDFTWTAPGEDFDSGKLMQNVPLFFF